MVSIPAGVFRMGTPPGSGFRDEGPQHQVSVKSFHLGKYEVTQAQYQAVMGTNPSHFKGDSLPVENATWDDAKEFCRRLSQMTGREYRLPSEAEWEYACRAGTAGDYAGSLDALAWYQANSGLKPHPVGAKRANTFGLYDMHGNVGEWCEDNYHRSYDGAPADGSAWLSGGLSTLGVVRGGSCLDPAVGLRSAARRFLPKSDQRARDVGFRVAASR